MIHLQSKQQIQQFTLLLSCTYMVSYITRINYGAIISEMVSATGISRDLLSMSLVGSFITYGCGQVISGILGDHIAPKKLVSLGLMITIVMNLLIPLCSGPYQMLAIWCINGFAQSFMWPPIVWMMSAMLSEDEYKKTTTKVSWGSSVGTILVYLGAPLIISFLSWKWVFVICACVGVVMLSVWSKYASDVKVEQRKVMETNTTFTISPLIICIMIAIVLQGMLRDGVTTWMPSYIAETYEISNIVSILTGVVLPIFSIVCFYIADELYRHKLRNPLVCAGVFFLVGSVAALVLFRINDQSAIVSVLCSALLTGCMHGVNLMLICMLPPYFTKHGNVSSMSGLLNSCTYVGSAISTYGIAVISQEMGWNTTIGIWLGIALLGMFLCFGCARRWYKQYME